MVSISANGTRCLLDLQGSLGVQTTKSRPTQILETSAAPIGSNFWRKLFTEELADQTWQIEEPPRGTQRPIVPIQEKGRRVSTHIQDSRFSGQETHQRVQLSYCTSDSFLAQIIITANKDRSIKLAIDTKPMSAQI